LLEVDQAPSLTPGTMLAAMSRDDFLYAISLLWVGLLAGIMLALIVAA
jgi:hypothetical protein